MTESRRSSGVIPVMVKRAVSPGVGGGQFLEAALQGGYLVRGEDGVDDDEAVAPELRGEIFGSHRNSSRGPAQR